MYVACGFKISVFVSQVNVEGSCKLSVDDTLVY